MTPTFYQLSRAKRLAAEIGEDIVLALHDSDAEMKAFWARRARGSLHQLAFELGYELVEIKKEDEA